MIRTLLLGAMIKVIAVVFVAWDLDANGSIFPLSNNKTIPSPKDNLEYNMFRDYLTSARYISCP